jgi:hypothetical protein
MNKFRVAAVFLAAILASGCMSVSTDVHISKDAEIDRINTKIKLNETATERYQNYTRNFSGSTANPDTAKNYTPRTFTPSEEKLMNERELGINYSEQERRNYTQSGRKIWSVTRYNVEPRDRINMTVYKKDGKIIFKDPNFAAVVGPGEEAEMEYMTDETLNLSYDVYMPGPIVETSGNIREENIATYDLEDLVNSTDEGVYVKSKVSEGGIASSVVSFFTGLI